MFKLQPWTVIPTHAALFSLSSFNYFIFNIIYNSLNTKDDVIIPLVTSIC